MGREALVNISIQKKHFYFLSALIILLATIGLTYAYNSGGPASVMGHDAEELEGVCLSDGTNCLSSGWQTISYEDFESGATGWSDTTTYTCITKLLGRFSGGCVSKTYTNLPTHTIVKVSAEYYFGDSWDGEKAYAKLDGTTVWYDVHSQTGQSFCASSSPDGNEYIELRKSHTASTLTVEFCSNLDSAVSDEWFGVDDIEISVQ